MREGSGCNVFALQILSGFHKVKCIVKKCLCWIRNTPWLHQNLKELKY